MFRILNSPLKFLGQCYPADDEWNLNHSLQKANPCPHQPIFGSILPTNAWAGVSVHWTRRKRIARGEFMEKYFGFLATTIISCLFTTNLSAAESGFYVGGGFGYTKADTISKHEIVQSLPVNKLFSPSSPTALAIGSPPFGFTTPFPSPSFITSIPVNPPGLPPGSSIVETNPTSSRTNIEVDDGDTGWKLFVGYDFDPLFGVELAYVDLGESETTFQVDESFTISPDPVLATGFVIIPVSTTTDFNTVSDLKSDVDGFSFSGRLKYSFSKKIKLFAKAGIYFWDADPRVLSAVRNQTNTLNSPINPLFSNTPFVSTVQPNPIDGTNELNAALEKLDNDGISPTIGAGIQYDLFEQVSIRLDWDYYHDVVNDNVHTVQAGIQYHF
jgi:opacity protein-like surface antigen